MPKPPSTVDAILACARSLIIAGGYNGFSYADIAEVVGIRKPSIHHHFPSKVDLVTTLVSQYREEAEQGVAHLERALPVASDQLRAYIDYWKTCITDASAPFCVCALLAIEMPILPDEVASQVRGYFRFLSGWLCSVIERGVEQGVFVLSRAPQVEAEALMAMVHGAMLSARAYDDPHTFVSLLEPTLERLSSSP